MAVALVPAMLAAALPAVRLRASSPQSRSESPTEPGRASEAVESFCALPPSGLPAPGASVDGVGGVPEDGERVTAAAGPEVPQVVARHHGVRCASTRTCRAAQAEHRGELAEVAARLDHLQQLLATLGQIAHDLDRAFVDLVYEHALVALAEEELAGRELDPLGRPLIQDRAG